LVIPNLQLPINISVMNILNYVNSVILLKSGVQTSTPLPGQFKSQSDAKLNTLCDVTSRPVKFQASSPGQFKNLAN